MNFQGHSNLENEVFQVLIKVYPNDLFWLEVWGLLMFPHLLKQRLRNRTFKWRLRIVILALNPLQSFTIYNRDDLATEIPLKWPKLMCCLSSILFLKIIIVISRTLQAVKIYMELCAIYFGQKPIFAFPKFLIAFSPCLTSKSNGFISVPILPYLRKTCHPSPTPGGPTALLRIPH